MTPSSPWWAHEGIPGTEPGPQLSAVWAHIVRLHALLPHPRLAVHALLPHPLLAIHSLLPAAQSCTDQCKAQNSCVALSHPGLAICLLLPAYAQVSKDLQKSCVALFHPGLAAYHLLPAVQP